MIDQNGSNAILTPVQEVIASLSNDKQHTFHLTGSRFFGMETSDSDYDFFVQDSKDIHGLLLSMGFQRLPCPQSYKDSMTDVVYRRLFFDDGMNGQIDVQVVKCTKIKGLAQEILKEFCPEHVVGHSNLVRQADPRRKLWEMAYMMASLQIENGIFKKRLSILGESYQNALKVV